MMSIGIHMFNGPVKVQLVGPQALRLGWVFTEEIGVAIINEAALPSLEGRMALAQTRTELLRVANDYQRNGRQSVTIDYEVPMFNGTVRINLTDSPAMQRRENLAQIMAGQIGAAIDYTAIGRRLIIGDDLQ